MSAIQPPPPPPSGPPPQYGQPYLGYPPPAPKKKHTLRNVLLIVGALFILLFAGCVALIGGVANEVDKSIKEREANSAPHPVDEGDSITIGKYTVHNGWSIGRAPGSGYTAKNVVVEDTSGETDTVFFTIKVLKGSEVLASIDCNTDQIEPGQQQKANCVDLGSRKFTSDWDRITIESTF